MSLKCSSPDCENNTGLKQVDEYYFCRECRSKHSSTALLVQVEHEKPIREVILDSRIFKSANGMADYIGVSFVSLYNWIEKYFKNDEGNGMTYQEFRREYICRSKKCILLDIRRSTYHRPDYIIRKIRNRGRCACINSLDNRYIMTNASPYELRDLMASHPTIQKISEGYYAIYPTIAKVIDICQVKVIKVKAAHVERFERAAKIGE